jgi:homoserine O-succinyltransferase
MSLIVPTTEPPCSTLRSRDTLLREYRRDVGRFLRGELKLYPTTPQGLFKDDGGAIAGEFRDRARVDRREHLIHSFPMSALKMRLENTWRINSISIYKKWIEYLGACKAEHRISRVRKKSHRLKEKAL